MPRSADDAQLVVRILSRFFRDVQGLRIGLRRRPAAVLLPFGSDPEGVFPHPELSGADELAALYLVVKTNARPEVREIGGQPMSREPRAEPCIPGSLGGREQTIGGFGHRSVLPTRRVGWLPSPADGLVASPTLFFGRSTASWHIGTSSYIDELAS